MSELIGIIVNALSGGAGKAISTGVANVSKLVTLAPVVMWLIPHRDEIAVSLTWGHLAIAGALAYFVLELTHRTPPQ